MAQAVGFEPTELFRVQLISSQSRYDRFDTPAYIFWHRLAQRLEKCEISMQDNDERLGTRHPIKPVVMGFPADKVTCRMQTFESFSLRPLRYISMKWGGRGKMPDGLPSYYSKFAAQGQLFCENARGMFRTAFPPCGRPGLLIRPQSPDGGCSAGRKRR